MSLDLLMSVLSTLLSPLGITHTGVKSSAAETDNYFTSLLNLLPPDNYFDNDALNELKGAISNPVIIQQCDQKLISTAKIPEASTVAMCALLLEINEEYKRRGSVAKSRLTNKIKQLRSKRNMVESQEEKKEKRLERAKKENKKQKKKKSNRIKTTIMPINTVAQNEQPRSSGESLPLFSRFQFLNDNGSKNEKDKNNKMSKEQLLKMAEKRKEKLESIREVDGQKALHIESTDAWKNALNKARGVKVQDDVKYLKKAIRKEHSLKRRSARQWADRKKQEDSKKSLRAEKRQNNLDKARAMKAKKKIKRAVAKGRILPGF